MTCKICKDDAIPNFLCRACHPDLATKATPIETEEPSSSIDCGEMIRKHKLKKLRAEERRLSKVAEDLGARDPKARNKVFALLKEVEAQIAKLTPKSPEEWP